MSWHIRRQSRQLFKHEPELQINQYSETRTYDCYIETDRYRQIDKPSYRYTRKHYRRVIHRAAPQSRPVRSMSAASIQSSCFPMQPTQRNPHPHLKCRGGLFSGPVMGPPGVCVCVCVWLYSRYLGISAFLAHEPLICNPACLEFPSTWPANQGDRPGACAITPRTGRQADRINSQPACLPAN